MGWPNKLSPTISPKIIQHQSRKRWEIMCRDTPYLCPISLNLSHGLSWGISNTFPTNGRGLGPGGKGQPLRIVALISGQVGEAETSDERRGRQHRYGGICVREELAHGQLTGRRGLVRGVWEGLGKRNRANKILFFILQRRRDRRFNRVECSECYSTGWLVINSRYGCRPQRIPTFSGKTRLPSRPIFLLSVQMTERSTTGGQRCRLGG